MPRGEGQIPEKLRDDPSLPDEERRRRARKRFAIMQGEARGEEAIGRTDMQLAAFLNLVELFARSTTSTPGPTGVPALTPEATQKLGQILQYIGSHPWEVGKVVLQEYVEDPTQVFGDIEMAALPFIVKLGRAVDVLRAGGNAEQAVRAYRGAKAFERAIGDPARIARRAEFEVMDSGDFLTVDGPAGSVVAQRRGDVYRVTGATTTHKGEGAGTDMYMRLAEEVEQRGGSLISDIPDRISDDARRLWQSLVDKDIAHRSGDRFVMRPRNEWPDQPPELISTPDVEDALRTPIGPYARAEGAEDMVELVHYGPKADELTFVDPQFQGTGQAGAERARREAMGDERYLPRSYYYNERAGQRVEPRFRGQPSTRVRIPRSQIYDLTEDPMNLIDHARMLAAEDKLYGDKAVMTYVEQLAHNSGFVALNDGDKVVAFERLPTVPDDALPLPRDPGPMRAVQPVHQDVADSIFDYGGATFDARTGANMGDSGKYAVSPFKMREQVFDHPPTPQEVAEFAQRNGDLLMGHDDVFLGGWKDGDKWYLDATMLVDDEAQAMRIARATDQEGFTLLDGKTFPTTRLTDADRDPIEAARIRHQLMEEIPSYREAVEMDMLEHMTEAERAEYARAGKRQDLWLRSYSMSPTPQEWASLIELGYDQRSFYPLSQMALGAFGDDAARFTALTSALSPKRSVKENLKFATEIWEQWNRSGRTQNPERIAAMFHPDDTTQQNAIKVLLADNAELLDESILEAGGLLSGLKVDPFYANLMGETQRVTLDTHMARGVGIEPKEFTQYRNRPVAASLRAGTDYYNRISGRPPITPSEAQAAAWAPIRTMTSSAGRRMRGMEAPPSVYDEFFDFPYGDQAIAERVPREIMEVIEQEGGDFGDVMRRDPALRARIEEAAGRPVKVGAPPEHAPVRPEIMRERDIGGIARRIDLSRSGDYLFGIGLAASPVLKRYFEEAEKQRQEQQRSPFRLFGEEDFQP